jgi:hypothetical protein
LPFGVQNFVEVDVFILSSFMNYGSVLSIQRALEVPVRAHPLVIRGLHGIVCGAKSDFPLRSTRTNGFGTVALQNGMKLYPRTIASSECGLFVTQIFQLMT